MLAERHALLSEGVHGPMRVGVATTGGKDVVQPHVESDTGGALLDEVSVGRVGFEDGVVRGGAAVGWMAAIANAAVVEIVCAGIVVVAARFPTPLDPTGEGGAKDAGCTAARGGHIAKLMCVGIPMY